MRSVVYSKEKIEGDDLRQFTEIALNVLSSTPYGRKYKASLVTIALCQGGANHYVVTNGYARRYFDPKRNGLKDIDIWFFFSKQGFHPQWHQTRDFGPSKFGTIPKSLAMSDVKWTSTVVRFSSALKIPYILLWCGG